MDSTILNTTHGEWKLVGALSSDQSVRTDAFEALMTAAREAKSNAYAPYSGFQVGSAVMMNGETFVGCNVENASYGATNCAERTAIFSGIAAGKSSIDILALSAGKNPDGPLEDRAPCGICRQVISEFATPSTLILVDAGQNDRLSFLGEVIPRSHLLPWSFRLKT